MREALADIRTTLGSGSAGVPNVGRVVSSEFLGDGGEADGFRDWSRR
jgi:hypothetical protein